MITVDWKAVANTLRIGEKILDLGTVAAAGNPIAAAIVKGAAEGLGLVADLAEKGLHPIESITRIRTSVRDFDVTAADLEHYARTGLRR
jgi:hypothetical protein